MFLCTAAKQVLQRVEHQTFSAELIGRSVTKSRISTNKEKGCSQELGSRRE
jgi:hypothetical protein